MRCICDECGRDEVVPADHGKGDSGAAQAAKKLQAHGWAYVRKHLRCPSCEAKRKAFTMRKDGEAQTVVKLREPSREQRREIMELLREVYNTDAERYGGGETDSSVAEVLGVMPGWVADIREEFFGPDGGNEDMAELVGDLEALRIDLGALQRDTASNLGKLQRDTNSILDKLQDRLEELTTRSEAIRKAVGPHVLKKAGVK